MILIFILIQCIIITVQVIHHLGKPFFGIFQRFIVNDRRHFFFKYVKQLHLLNDADLLAAFGQVERFEFLRQFFSFLFRQSDS